MYKIHILKSGWRLKSHIGTWTSLATHCPQISSALHFVRVTKRHHENKWGTFLGVNLTTCILIFGSSFILQQLYRRKNLPLSRACAAALSGSKSGKMEEMFRVKCWIKISRFLEWERWATINHKTRGRSLLLLVTTLSILSAISLARLWIKGGPLAMKGE